MNESTSKRVLAICAIAIALLFLSNVFLYNEIRQDNDRLDDIEKVMESAVMVFARDSDDELSGNGSGFIVEHEGSILVVTCAHIVIKESIIEDDPSVRPYDIIICTVYRSYEEYDLKVLKYDVDLDLAVLEFVDDVDLPALALGDSDKLRYGQYVYTIGNPEEVGFSFTSGSISSPSVLIEGRYTGWAIMTDTAINPGNSGGPLLSENNEVIGVIFAKSLGERDENMGFAIPSNVLSGFLGTV